MSKGLIGFLWHETLKPLRQISKSAFTFCIDLTTKVSNSLENFQHTSCSDNHSLLYIFIGTCSYLLFLFSVRWSNKLGVCSHDNFEWDKGLYPKKTNQNIPYMVFCHLAVTGRQYFYITFLYISDTPRIKMEIHKWPRLIIF